MQKREVEILKVPSDLDELFKTYRSSRTQGGNLGAAFDVADRIYKNDATVFLSVAGAVTPTGAGGYIIDMIESGHIDVIVATGANITHDLHFALGTPLFHCDPHEVDDFELQKNHQERIYDVLLDPTCISEVGKFIRGLVRQLNLPAPISTSRFINLLGQAIIANDVSNAHKSFVAMAALKGVPIYCSAPSDSEVGMNYGLEQMDDKILGREKTSLVINNSLDFPELAGIFLTASKTALIVIGGGHPKNYVTQISPFVKEDLIYPNIRQNFPRYIQRGPDDIGGLDYMIKISTDVPHFGGCSGATESENLTWQKIKPKVLHEKDGIEINADYSLAFPILAAYIKTNIGQRKPKGLFDRLLNLRDIAMEVRKKRIAVLGLDSKRD